MGHAHPEGSSLVPSPTSRASQVHTQVYLGCVWQGGPGSALSWELQSPADRDTPSLGTQSLHRLGQERSGMGPLGDPGPLWLVSILGCSPARPGDSTGSFSLDSALRTRMEPFCWEPACPSARHCPSVCVRGGSSARWGAVLSAATRGRARQSRGSARGRCAPRATVQTLAAGRTDAAPLCPTALPPRRRPPQLLGP